MAHLLTLGQQTLLLRQAFCEPVQLRVHRLPFVLPLLRLTRRALLRHHTLQLLLAPRRRHRRRRVALSLQLRARQCLVQRAVQPIALPQSMRYPNP